MQATPGKTLMIVDQLAMYREGLRRLLYESGFHAIWCHDDLPDDLPAALSQHPPELLLIGTDVATARRQIAEVKRCYPSCRIVLLLDTDPPDEMEAALECGADSIIRRESSCDALYAELPSFKINKPLTDNDNLQSNPSFTGYTATSSSSNARR